MSIEFITIQDQHWYKSEKKKDVYYPSCTTILSCFPKGTGFNKYLAGQDSWESSQEILKSAGLRGTNVHEGSCKLEKGETLSRMMYTLEEWNHLIGFVNWFNAFVPERVEMEIGLVSDKLKTGGTIDRVYMIDGMRTLLDIKTSSAIYDNYWAQTAAYVALWNEKFPDKKIEKTAILRTAPRKKGGYEYKTHDLDEIKEDMKVFKSVMEIWNYLNPGARPKIVEVPDTLKL